MADNVMNTETPVEGETQTEWYYSNIANFYTRVRTALNVGQTISNATIDYFENAPMAEITIKERVPKWESLDTLQRALFDTCIVYMTCHNLCPLVNANKMTKMKDPSLEITYSANTDKADCARFINLVDDLVAKLNGDKPRPLFWGFKVTPPSPPFCCVPHCPPPPPCPPHDDEGDDDDMCDCYLSGEGAPGETLPGRLGQDYLDTDTGDKWYLAAIDGGRYIWRPYGADEIPDDELLAVLLAADVLPCVADGGGAVLTDEQSAILMM